MAMHQLSHPQLELQVLAITSHRTEGVHPYQSSKGLELNPNKGESGNEISENMEGEEGAAKGDEIMQKCQKQRGNKGIVKV